MTRWKKTLLILSGVALLLCLIGGGFLVRWGNQAIHVVENDAAAYGNNVLNEISQDWQVETLLMHAEPEMKVNIDPEQVQKMLDEMSEALGKLEDGKGQGQMIDDSEIAGEQAVGVMYVSKAKFERGRADVKIYLVRRPESGDWLIKSFDVTPVE